MKTSEVKKAQGFTLVELLVVIGIIAMLISILLPTLASARRVANQTKCAAQLRNIINAAKFYAIDNKGYYPPMRIGNEPKATAGNGQYNIGGVNYNATATTADGLNTTSAAWWWNFLAKYLTSSTASQSAGQKAQNDLQRSVIWGCPSFSKFPGGSATDPLEWRPNFTGYAWNPHPAFTPIYPVASTPNSGSGRRPPETFVNNGNFQAGTYGSAGFSALGVVSRDKFKTYGGKWYKESAYTRPSERALVADSFWYALEANAPVSATDLPGQRNFNFPEVDPVEFATTTGQQTTGQTSFDWYRHGKLPPIHDPGPTGSFAAFGGKVAFNVLYADGHVGQSSAKGDAYLAVRQRFPEP